MLSNFTTHEAVKNIQERGKQRHGNEPWNCQAKVQIFLGDISAAPCVIGGNQGMPSLALNSD